jgi:hypothetical protein
MQNIVRPMIANTIHTMMCKKKWKVTIINSIQQNTRLHIIIIHITD